MAREKEARKKTVGGFAFGDRNAKKRGNDFCFFFARSNKSRSQNTSPAPQATPLSRSLGHTQVRERKEKKEEKKKEQKRRNRTRWLI
jgi:hypothetical protein